MRTHTFLLIFLASYVVASAAGENSTTPFFTNSDLKQYGSGSDAPAAGGSSSEEPVSSEAQRAVPARHSVPYTAFEGMAGRIIVPVTVNEAVTVNMAIDTGSPGMIISHRLAKRLGIFDRDVGKLMTYAAGIGGTVPVILTIIDTVRINGASEQFVPAIITPALSGSFEGLIGMDFMANYSISIDTAQHVIILEELPERENMPAGHDERWWRNHFSRFSAMRNEWRKLIDALGDSGPDRQEHQELRDFAESQYHEANVLFNKLNSYAILHAVPMSWREF